jgi:hypothetical protein
MFQVRSQVAKVFSIPLKMNGSGNLLLALGLKDPETHLFEDEGGEIATTRAEIDASIKIECAVDVRS